MTRRSWRALLIGGLASLAVGVPAAQAGTVYVTSSSGEMLRLNSATNQPVAPSIPVDGREIVVTPDGTRAYVATEGGVTVVNLVAGQVLGNIPVPVTAMAIAPDGRRLYVVTQTTDTVTIVDTLTNQVVGTVTVPQEPRGIALTPDGSRFLVTSDGITARSITAYSTATGAPIGDSQRIGFVPAGITLTPDGSRAYVASAVDGTPQRLFGAIYSVDLPSMQVSENPVVIEDDLPLRLAITPDGRKLFAAGFDQSRLWAIDVATGRLSDVQAATDVFLAMAPDGRHVYAPGLGELSIVDTQAVQLTASVSFGEFAGPNGIAIAPNQPPVASFSTRRVRPGVPAVLDASSSKDPDGAPAGFAWSFGDGSSNIVPTSATAHVFAKPGTYTASLTLTDNEGCSTSLVFTGQTALCNGSAVATTTRKVVVAYPGVRVACAKSAKPKGCAFKLQVVAKKPKRGKKAKFQSAVAKVKVKAGKSAIVSLKAKAPFAAKLGGASSVLVKETKTVGGKRSTGFRKLKIVQ